MLTLLTLGLLAPAHAVEVKEISSYGQKKLKKAPKRVFIEDFRVVYQLIASDTEVAEGGREIGGGYRGDATASLTLAVKGVSEENLNGITNALYTAYISKLEEAGLELVTADEAQGTRHYAEWERKQSDGLSMVQFPGYLMSRPDGLEYFVKRTTAKGKEKRGLFDAGAHKLSADLDGAIVARVGLVVPFVVDAESGLSKGLTKTLGGVAKVVMKPDLRVSKQGIATGPGNVVSTKATYTYATRRVGADAVANFELKTDLDIPGVMEEKKYKASESANVDQWGADYGAIRVFRVDDALMAKAQAVEVDPDAYRDGVQSAGLDFIASTTETLLGYVNR